MENYIKIDEIVKDMTAQDLADYLLHNWEEYAEDLYIQLSLQSIILRGETDARED